MGPTHATCFICQNAYSYMYGLFDMEKGRVGAQPRPIVTIVYYTYIIVCGRVYIAMYIAMFS